MQGRQHPLHSGDERVRLPRRQRPRHHQTLHLVRQHVVGRSVSSWPLEYLMHRLRNQVSHHVEHLDALGVLAARPQAPRLRTRGQRPHTHGPDTNPRRPTLSRLARPKASRHTGDTSCQLPPCSRSQQRAYASSASARSSSRAASPSSRSSARTAARSSSQSAAAPPSSVSASPQSPLATVRIHALPPREISRPVGHRTAPETRGRRQRGPQQLRVHDESPESCRRLAGDSWKVDTEKQSTDTGDRRADTVLGTKMLLMSLQLHEPRTKTQRKETRRHNLVQVINT